MKLILCLDVDNGMTFNDRRQSRDREVIKDIVRYVGNERIVISEYTTGLFEGIKANVVVSDFKNEEMNYIVFDASKTEVMKNDDDLKYKSDNKDKCDKTDGQDFYFIEKIEHLNKINWNKIDELILYRWDKKYPADCTMDIDWDAFKLKDIMEFQGYSHHKIAREVYVKNEG